MLQREEIKVPSMAERASERHIRIVSTGEGAQWGKQSQMGDNASTFSMMTRLTNRKLRDNWIEVRPQ